ncbi:MAG: carbohydrate-binding domain-containing protein [Bacteroidaceae bacterium]|nr:carbohydrate-binding domain-containing protein [Bacteroidaceae bacterium]
MKHLLLLATLCLSLFACNNNEETANTEDDEDTVTIPQPVFVDVVFNESTAEINIPAEAIGVTCSSGNSTSVVLALDSAVQTEYIYRVRGYSASGSLTINSPYKLTLLLAGLQLTSTTAEPPLHLNCGKRINLILQENTVNTLADNPLNEKKGALYTKGHLEVEGGGVLNVTGNARHAIASKEYLQIKKTTGYIHILGSVGDGIHCGEGDGDPENNYFKISGGTLTFTDVQGDLIDCDDYGTAYINGGTLNLTVAADDTKGLKADSLIYMTDGTINLNVTGTAAIGIQSNYAAYFTGGTVTGTVAGINTVGIKGNDSKSSVTVVDGGYLYFSGTTVNLSVQGFGKCYALYSEHDITATGGTIALSGPADNAPGYKAKDTLTGEDFLSWTDTE